MTTVCSICEKVISRDDSPAILTAEGEEMVSHGAHQECMRVFYGEDFQDLLEGEPT